MTKDEVREKVFNLVSSQLGIPIDDTFGTKGFVADLNTDSLDTVELTMEVEDLFKIVIEDQEADMLSTPDQVVEFVFKKLNS